MGMGIAADKKHEQARKDLVIVSGRSGAGKTTAKKALEDMGYFVVDNLPLELVGDFLSLTSQARNDFNKVGLIINAPQTQALQAFGQTWRALDRKRFRKQ